MVHGDSADEAERGYNSNDLSGRPLALTWAVLNDRKTLPLCFFAPLAAFEFRLPFALTSLQSDQRLYCLAAYQVASDFSSATQAQEAKLDKPYAIQAAGYGL